ncbi:MAG TPA: hypothetical protein VKB40_05640 [Candidatus Acidoferrales bacterium]|nr:hypothetical protein [Candidatus Acidoferrales bacterium]
MSKWSLVAVFVLLVLTSAMGVQALANTTAPVPGGGWLAANTTAPVPQPW